jgi:hypothetical protein
VGLPLLVVAFVCWLGFEAFQAKSSLEEARHNAQQAKDALLAGNLEDAAKRVDDASSNAQGAQDATHSLPWNVASVVPWLGGPFRPGNRYPMSCTAR